MNAIALRMMERHQSTIFSALSALGWREESLCLADRWQELYDAGEAVDLYQRHYTMDETADVLWACLCGMLRDAWLRSITREHALAIGNALGPISDARVELAAGCSMLAREVPEEWNKAHPDEKPILRTSSSLM